MVKIMNIIPAPAGLTAYVNLHENTAEPFPAVCLALCEEDGDTYIDCAVAMGSDICLSQHISGLVAIEVEGSH